MINIMDMGCFRSLDDCFGGNTKFSNLQNGRIKNIDKWYLILACLFILGSCSEQTAVIPNTRPNILLIMADDMGYSDLGCMGGEIKTPYLDGLAENGLLFNQFYNNARCCPTRASLLTGLYPHQAGMGWMTIKDLGSPSYQGELNLNSITIPELCKKYGYNTYMSGKWHLTQADNMKADGNIDSWPLQRGFDRFFGTITGAGSYYDPPTLTVQNKPIAAPKDFYYTDAISDTTISMIRANQKTNKPFFAYVSYTAPHWPLHAPKEDFEPYVQTYIKGWDFIRQERYINLKKLGIVPEKSKLSERSIEAPDWKVLSEAEKKKMAQRMAVYAAQIEIMDRGIGRIVDELERSDLLDNTIIYFLQDNGASAELVSRGDTVLTSLGSIDSFESYRLPWANTSNSPFRMFKKWTYEGGISTPLIVHWPKGLVEPGRVSERPGQLMDIMATCVDLMNIEYPSQYVDRKIPALEGESFLDEISNEGKQDNDRLMFWEHEGNCAVRQGNWKLVFEGIGEVYLDESSRLYDLSTDRTESKDLSQKFPGKVMELRTHWEDWAKRAKVYPMDNRSWQERIDNPKALSQKRNSD